MKLNKYLQKGGITPRKVIVEKGEYIKDSEGEVFKIGPDMPSHDDTSLLIDGKEKKVKKGKGGVAITDVVQVVSATTENRRKKDKTHKDTDEAIKFFEEEGESFIFNTFGLKANLKRSVSPAGIIDATMDRIGSVTKKYGSLEFREDSPYAQRSAAANAAYLESLPSLEDVFDTVFEEQERKKEEAIITDEDEYAQIGGSVGKKFLKAQTGRKIPSPQDLGITSRVDRTTPIIRNAVKDQKEIFDNKVRERVPGELRQTKRQSISGKVLDTVLNPMTAAGYMVREGRVPDNFSRSEEYQNLADYAISAAMPARYALAQAATELGADASNDRLSEASLLGILGINTRFKKWSPNFNKNNPSIKTNPKIYEETDEEILKRYKQNQEEFENDNVINLPKHNYENYLSENKPSDDFISDIDWGKWNKEIPLNKNLIDEYNNIENTAKKNGTWMKNIDGSAFQGTPEQFIQQRSSNFKKAFPYILKDKKGDIERNYHGSSTSSIKEIDSKIKNNGRLFGDGFYTSSDKKEALTYARGDDPSLYQFYLNASRMIDEDKLLNNHFKYSDIINTADKNSPEFKNAMEKYTSLQDFGIKLSGTRDFFKYNNIQVTPFSNRVKSAIGNNGMFDMTNPNIYKGLALPAIGVSAASKVLKEEEKQTGGTVQPKYIKAQTGRRVPSPQDLGVLNPSDRASLQVRNSLKDSSSVRAAKEAAAIKDAEERRSSAKLTPYNPQSVGSKAIDVALNPMATAGYLVREGRVPDHMVHGQQNLFDSALQLGLSGGAAAVASGLSVTKDLTSGEAGLGTAVEAASGLVGARDAVSKYRKFSEAQRRLKEMNRIKYRLEAPQEGINWMRKWYNDPITKEKADKFFANNYPKHFTKDDLEDKVQLLSGDEMQSLSLDRVKNNDNRVQGSYYLDAVDRYPDSATEKDFPMSGKIYVADTERNTPEEITSTTIHELTHLMTDAERFLSDDNARALSKNLKTFEEKYPYFLSNYDKYLSEPTEIYARFNELRKAEGLTPSSEISTELMNKIMEKGLSGQYSIDSRFFELIKDPEYTRGFLNKILPASVGAVGTAGLVSQNQKQQTGGNTKGVLQSPNRNLITTVRLKSGKVVPIESIDGVVPDRAAPYLAPDSVNVTKDWLGRYHAERYYDSKLKKYLK